MTINQLKKAVAEYIDGFKTDVNNTEMTLDYWYDIQRQVTEIVSSLVTILLLEKYEEKMNDEETEGHNEHAD